MESAKALTTIAARKEELTDLIEHADQTFQAIGSQQSSLARAAGAARDAEPGQQDVRRGPAAIGAFKQLVEVSKPNTQDARDLFARLHPLVSAATPVVSNFSLAISTTGCEQRPDRSVRRAAGARPGADDGLARRRQIAAGIGADHRLLRPLRPDLAGTLRTFGQATAYYDANGHYARISPVAPAFKLGATDNLTPASPQQGLEGLQTGQLRRCPGAATQPAADGSSPFTDNELLNCDPSETPK